MGKWVCVPQTGLGSLKVFRERDIVGLGLFMGLLTVRKNIKRLIRLLFILFFIICKLRYAHSCIMCDHGPVGH